MNIFAKYLSAFLVFLAGTCYLRANYLPVFLERNEGLQLEKKSDYLGALIRFKVDLVFLEKAHEQDPAWQHDLVMKAISDYHAKVATLEPLAIKQINEKQKAALSSGPSDLMLYNEGLKESDAWRAMNDVEEYLTTLEIMHRKNPQWERDVIEDRIKTSEIEMDHLEMIALKPISGSPAGEQVMQ